MYFLFCPLRLLTEGIDIEHTLYADTPENLINHLFSLCDCLCDFVCSLTYGKDTEVKFKSIVLITRIGQEADVLENITYLVELIAKIKD